MDTKNLSDKHTKAGLAMPTVSTENLLALIRATAAKMLQDPDGCNPHELTATLRKIVEPNCHDGKAEQMDGSDAGYRMQLEWYAGQLLDLIDNGNWWIARKSWPAAVDKHTARDIDQTPQRADETA